MHQINISTTMKFTHAITATAIYSLLDVVTILLEPEKIE